MFYGYESYGGLLTTFKGKGFLTNCVICVDILEPNPKWVATSYVLVSIWRTRCSKPRNDAVIYCFIDDTCYLIKDVIKFMADKFTNPSLQFNLNKVDK